ncbi:MAG: PTS fructose transporter subunit IIA [Aerococcus sp.]|nr:PTS fructose transporter subunit IIA [Aerococcus sp.]
MTKSLILISHGTMCEGLKETTEMIMGPQENIYTVPLYPDEGREDFEKKFDAVAKDLDDYIVFCDLQGGTPSNVISKKIIEGEDIDLYAGMNVPMVIAFINGELLGTPVDIVEETTSNISHVNELLQAAADDDDDEM